MRKKLLSLATAVFLFAGMSLTGQPVQGVAPQLERSAGGPVDSLISAGDSLHLHYFFDEAISRYMEAAEKATDEATLTILQAKVNCSQAALNMTEVCADPHVVARKTFSRKDFYQYYPVKGGSWRPSPNVLDSLEGQPLYFPKGDRQIYFSAADNAGTRSLFCTFNRDSAWTAPRLLGESLLSTGSEIFPMLSPDGKTLYFASDGMGGMGGYDIYSSAWDEETGSWQEPENMGFPFNSPSDDFLLLDSDDGKYTFFASNRDCSKDSVTVYVLDFQGSRDKKPAASREDLLRIVSLLPSADPARLDHASFAGEVEETDNTILFSRKTDEARALTDSISRHLADTSKVQLEAFRARLEQVQQEINAIMQGFMQEGVMENSKDVQEEVVVAEVEQSYTFTKHPMGFKPRIKVPKCVRGNSYRIMPIGRIAQDAPLPDGLVYQIHLASVLRPLGVEDIGGLTPVYKRLPRNLKHTYYVGLFTTYDEALAELNVVRLRGFPEATIVAWMDGRQVPIAAALEKERNK